MHLITEKNLIALIKKFGLHSTSLYVRSKMDESEFMNFLWKLPDEFDYFFSVKYIRNFLIKLNYCNVWLTRT